MRTSTGAIYAGTLVAALTGTLLAQEHVPMTDEQIRTLIEHELDDAKLSDGRSDVQVSDRVVALRGRVPSVWAKDKAIQVAFDAPDVEAVDHELEVSSAESDEALAKAVARRVRRYAFYTVYDDINVRVEDGAVTLIGSATIALQSDRNRQHDRPSLWSSVSRQ